MDDGFEWPDEASEERAPVHVDPDTRPPWWDVERPRSREVTKFVVPVLLLLVVLVVLAGPRLPGGTQDGPILLDGGAAGRPPSVARASDLRAELSSITVAMQLRELDVTAAFLERAAVAQERGITMAFTGTDDDWCITASTAELIYRLRPDGTVTEGHC